MDGNDNQGLNSGGLVGKRGGGVGLGGWMFSF